MTRAIPRDTIFFTGYQQVASSYYMHVEPVGHDESFESQYRCTTRQGFLCGTTHDAMTGENLAAVPYADVDPGLASEHRALMDRLVNVWRGQGLDTEARMSALHYSATTSSDGDRPDRATIPTFMEDTAYRIRFDWALPYVLRPEGESSVSIYPFELRRSSVAGQAIEREGETHWNRTYIVRFSRSASWDETRTYDTEVLDERGRVVRRLSPPRPGDDDPAWMRRRDGSSSEDPMVPKARIILPHFQGFVLLHKLFTKMLEAYEQLSSYRLAMAVLQRDLHRIERIDRMFDLASRNTSNGETHQFAGRAFRLLQSFRLQTEQSMAALGREQERIGTGEGVAFRYLVDFFSGDEDPSRLRPTFERDWYSFPQFLGPLTFLELSVWLIRQSPLATEFYNRFGGALAERPAGRRSGAWSEDEDPMLLDERYIGRPTIPDVRPYMSWTKRSLKVYASVNQMFWTFHVDALWQAAFLRQPFSMHIDPEAGFTAFRNFDDLREFAESVTGDAAARRFIDDMEEWAHHTYGGMRSPAFHLREHPEEVARRLEAVQFHRRHELPTIAKALDGLSQVISVIMLVDSLEREPELWTPANVFLIGTTMLGLSNTAASLLGASELFAFKRVLGPLAAVIDIGTNGYRSIRAFSRGDAFTGSMRALQVIGAGCCLAAAYTSATVYGVPASAVLVVTGTVIVLGAEVALWVEENVDDDWERHTRSVWDELLEPVTTYHWDAIAERPITTHLFRSVMRRHQREKGQWADYTIEDWNLADIIRDDDSWNDFPEPIWRYCDRADATFEARYRTFCQALARESGTRWPPADWDRPEAPPPPPLRYPRPAAVGGRLEYDP